MTMISAMIFVVQSYRVNCLCQNIAQAIAMCGYYDQTMVEEMLTQQGGDQLEHLSATVDATYVADTKIQKQDSFSVEVTATYPITILQMGSSSVLELPIVATVYGISQVEWP